MRRIKIVPHKAKFVDNPKKPNQRLKDENLKYRLPELGKMFIHYLINKWLPIYNEKGIYFTPEAVNVFTNDYINDNDIIKNFIDEHLEEHPDSFLEKHELKRAYSLDSSIKNKFKYNEFISLLEEKLDKEFHRCNKRNEYRDKLVLEGYRLKESE